MQTIPRSPKSVQPRSSQHAAPPTPLPEPIAGPCDRCGTPSRDLIGAGLEGLCAYCAADLLGVL